MFNFSFDNRILWMILGIMLLISLSTVATQPGGIIGFILTIPAVIIAITFHEFAHAFAADKLGDATPRMQGRLNLNPLSHIDPIGIMLLLFAGFGWGKPVQINPRNFNRDMPLSKAEAIVAAAGPIMNFIIAFVFLVIMYLLQEFGITAGQYTLYLYLFLSYVVSINIGLGVFNLIPLPPLDGSKILMHFLPYNARNWFINKQYIFYIVFLALWITGLSGLILQPLFQAVITGMEFIVSSIFNLF